MELESEILFASTWDNVEAKLKRILVILSETFDKNTDFEAASENTSDWAGHFRQL